MCAYEIRVFQNHQLLLDLEDQVLQCPGNLRVHIANVHTRQLLVLAEQPAIKDGAQRQINGAGVEQGLADKLPQDAKVRNGFPVVVFLINK